MAQHTALFPMKSEDAAKIQKACAAHYDLPPILRFELAFEAILEMVLIPEGDFLMGSLPETFGHSSQEAPLHQVIIGQPFYIGKFAVQQREWQAIMDQNRSKFPGVDLPVEMVTWNDCIRFCEALSERVERSVRLPCEAEWEYACRAGSGTAYYFGDEMEELHEYGWYRGNSSFRSQPVGRKLPNAWGLHDMHGGIAEFCLDTWHPNYHGAPPYGVEWSSGGDSAYRVTRGGSWYDQGEHCRSGYRTYHAVDMASEHQGLRVVMPVEDLAE